MKAGAPVTISFPDAGIAQAYRITILRLPTDGTNPAGSYNATPGSPYFGTYLHVEATFPSLGTSLAPNEGAVQPVTEWDPEGVEIFPPGCSQVRLVGGNEGGLYGVTFTRIPMPFLPGMPAGRLDLRLRWLKRYVPRNGGSFIVPAGHGLIDADNADEDVSGNATLKNVDDGVILRLGNGTPKQVISGTTIATIPGGPAVLAQTGFYA